MNKLLLIYITCMLGIMFNTNAQVAQGTIAKINDSLLIKPQKLIHRTNSHIGLADAYVSQPSINSVYSSIYMLPKSAMPLTNHKQYFPAGYKVTDIEVLSDTIYFCGYITDDGNNQMDGFIGYIGVDELFNQNHISPILKISKIPLSKIIRKLRVYKNNLGQIIVVGIGEMEYGHFLQFSPYPGAPPSYSPMESFDFLIKYEITEHHTGFNQFCNKFHYYRSRNKTNVEKFQDIVISDDTYSDGNIGVVSLIYETNYLLKKYAPNGMELSSRVNYRRFDRNTFQENHYFFNIDWYNCSNGQYYESNVLKGIYDVKLEDTKSSPNLLQPSYTFLMSYIHYDQADGLYANVINHMIYRPTPQNFCLLSTRINENIYGNNLNVWDIEQVLGGVFAGKSLILKEDNNNEDVVYELTNNTAFNNYFQSTSFTNYYEASAFKSYPLYGVVKPRWRVLSHFNNDNYLIDDTEYSCRLFGFNANNPIYSNGEPLMFNNYDNSESVCKRKYLYPAVEKPYPVGFYRIGNDFLTTCNWDMIEGLYLEVPVPNVIINKVTLSPSIKLGNTDLCIENK